MLRPLSFLLLAAFAFTSTASLAQSEGEPPPAEAQQPAPQATPVAPEPAPTEPPPQTAAPVTPAPATPQSAPPPAADAPAQAAVASILDGAIHARRSRAQVSIDGRLDEAAWAEAPGHDRFVETFPRDNVPASAEFRTEAKVLFDDEFLYVGVHAYDPKPNLIVAQLSRRDTVPTADLIQIAIDPAQNGKTAYSFVLNAAGVQRDLIFYSDVNSTDTWDAVWDGATHITADGWTAEFAIPLRVLRFRRGNNQTWGLHVRRVIPRTRQTLDSTYIPRSANPQNTGGLVVSRFGKVVDLIDLEPKPQLELLPYAAARVTSHPDLADPSTSLLDPSGDIGLDLKASLTSSLNLTATVNPDFGQVEADQIIQNVSNFEQFFPEKRPFFTEGLDLFQPVGAEYGAQQQLFYSRRIGLDTPIFTAAKLTGSIQESTEVGLLDALVMGAGNQGIGDRRYTFHWEQPFRFGPNSLLPAIRPTPANHLAGVVRHQFSPGVQVGGMITSAVPLGPACTRADFPTDEAFEAADCDSFGANAAAVDFNLRTKDGNWGALGQLGVTQALGGGEEGRLLPDGTVLRSNDLGTGFYFRAGKLGGEPFRFNINGTFEPPKFDLNVSGFQPFTNYQWYALEMSFVRPNGLGPFKSVSMGINVDCLNFSADGKWTPRGRNASYYVNLQLPSFDTLFMNTGFEFPQYDLREIAFTGIPVERMGSAFLAAGIATDQSRPLFGQITLVGSRTFDHDPVPGAWGYQTIGNLTWHPAPFLETYLAVEFVGRATGSRFVDCTGACDPEAGDDAIFGTQRPSFLSGTLRQQVVLTPKLTLQAYAQLFSGVITYGTFYRTPMNGQEPLNISDFTPISYTGNPNEHFSALNLNLVLRWEYRLGSTIYAVYTRSQQEPRPTGAPSDSVLPSGLFGGPVVQTALIKWSYWWDVG